MLQLATFFVVVAILFSDFFLPSYAVYCTPPTSEQVAAFEEISLHIEVPGSPSKPKPTCESVRLK